MKPREKHFPLVATRSLSQGPRQNSWVSTAKTDPKPDLMSTMHPLWAHGTLTNIADPWQNVNPVFIKVSYSRTREIQTQAFKSGVLARIDLYPRPVADFPTTP